MGLGISKRFSKSHPLPRRSCKSRIEHPLGGSRSVRRNKGSSQGDLGQYVRFTSGRPFRSPQGDCELSLVSSPFSPAVPSVTIVDRDHPCATFWADESLVLVFHHVVLSKRMGHETSSFSTLFHVVGMLCPFPACLLPLRDTLRV